MDEILPDQLAAQILDLIIEIAQLSPVQCEWFDGAGEFYISFTQEQLEAVLLIYPKKRLAKFITSDADGLDYFWRGQSVKPIFNKFGYEYQIN